MWMYSLLIFISVLLPWSSAHAQSSYQKWVDKDGRVHYSNAPTPGPNDTVTPLDMRDNSPIQNPALLNERLLKDMDQVHEWVQQAFEPNVKKEERIYLIKRAKSLLVQLRNDAIPLYKEYFPGYKARDQLQNLTDMEDSLNSMLDIFD